MTGESFQLVLGGVQRMVETENGLVGAGEVIPLDAPQQAVEEPRAVKLPTPRAKTPAQKQSVSPADVLRLARERVKELKAELRRMKSLQKELTELEALLGRSKKTTTKNVRPLRSAV